MRVHRTPRDRFFTVLGNEVIQDKRLSFTARGILVYLLSLEDGTKVNVRDLADENPGVGRRAVALALDELVSLGYYVRVTTRGDDGAIRTTTAVYDIPQTAASAQVVPIPRQPGTGQPHPGASGTNPVKETPGKETSPLPPVETASVAESAPEAPKGGGEGEASTQDEIAACAPVVARIGRQEPRLTVGIAEMGKVLPLVAEWRQRGASDDQIVHAVTSGLPGDIKSAVGLMRDRLTRKMPIRFTVTSATPAPALVECPECGRPGRVHGLCADCRTVEAPRPAEGARNRAADELRRRMGWKAAS
ncbi:hypothetical protein GCM10010149_48030 [Nonomuraea roseoviolacea subsp. roseoviolacea]|uniref:hypothetical protein n=1 Tax=Nonomuraea roseoviolacea TaxID=103837 RepID=UPI0031CEB8AF